MQKRVSKTFGWATFENKATSFFARKITRLSVPKECG